MYGRCRGRCKSTNKPCNWDFDLDPLGYCQYHSPLALQCRGVNTGNERCGREWKLNGDILCQDHQGQTIQCHGVSLQTYKRCTCTTSVNHHGFCPDHPERSEDILRDFAWIALGLTKIKPMKAVDPVPMSVDGPLLKTVKKQDPSHDPVKKE